MMGGGEIWRAGIADSREGGGRAIEYAREWASVPDRCDGPLWAAALGMRVVGGDEARGRRPDPGAPPLDRGPENPYRGKFAEHPLPALRG